ncbi:LuxR C-terminal-related transcriptional regulator [Streptomyces coelicoflavus]|uniref:LuxR C-terminal-related transcriptional regulator n=1 Tax=Streptomyces coelicoflavus TaxID=285562 RepID=UPI00344EB1DC
MTTDQVPPADSGALPHRTRVVAIDDDTVIRDGLPLLLPQLHVVAAFPEADAMLAAAPVADVVLIDLKLAGTGSAPYLQGPHAVRAVVLAGYRALVYTNEVRRAVLVNCLSAGARGIVHKAEPLAALADAVALVADGQVVITQALTGLVELAERRDQLPGLSPRERQVLAGRARGESFLSIGGRLYISPQTAAGYMDGVKQKFAAYLRDHSPADLEHYLGLEPSDLVDWQSHAPDSF